MAILTIPDEEKTLRRFHEVRHFLENRGITLEQWEASEPFSDEATQEEILAAYEHVLKPFMEKGGYQTADVISVNSSTPNLDEIRAKFLREHTHTEDEVRFFVDGQGYFWFNLEDEKNTPPFCVKCVAGDLLSVPANVKHWFDLGEPAFVKTIRIFTDASGWTPHYTESAVEARYTRDKVNL